MQPHRGRTTLIGFLMCQGRCVGRLVLGRSHGSPDFQRRDQVALRELLPTLSIAQHGYLLAGRTPPPSAAAVALCSELSPREREVCSYLGLGYTNEQIARALGTHSRRTQPAQ